MDKEVTNVQLKIGNSVPVLAYTFTLIVIMIWGATSGTFGPVTPEGTLVLGISQFACLPIYIVASKCLMEGGDQLMGNVFMAFSTAFGGICGMTNIAVGIGGIVGVEINPFLNNFALIWAGVLLLGATIAIRHAPVPLFLAFALGTWMLLTTAFMGLGVIPPVLGPVNNVVSIIIAVCGLYCVFSDIAGMGGVRIPQGPPMFPIKDKGDQQ